MTPHEVAQTLPQASIPQLLAALTRPERAQLYQIIARDLCDGLPMNPEITTVAVVAQLLAEALLARSGQP